MRLFYCLFLSFAALIGGLLAFKHNSSFPFAEPDIMYPAKFTSSPTKKITTEIPDNIAQGKRLFKINCAQCHNKNMVDDLTGPALKGVKERWLGKEALLYDWIRNSQAVIATGDPYAKELYTKWNKTLMNPFPNLTDEEIEAILEYIEQY